MRIICILPILQFSAALVPLSTLGSELVGADGKRVRYSGVNWPGHLDVMIPEGLQYQSIKQIVATIKSLNMNVVRLTYATEMVDDILAGHTNAKSGFIKALGERAGNDVWKRITQKNGWQDGITRLQIFDAVAAECANQGIMVHLDNHISKAMWCCGTQDGNSWFGDKYFDTEKWIRGWKFMANHTKSWSSLSSYGLRNELRSPDNNPALKKSYGWDTWTKHMRSVVQVVHKENPAAVIFLSGLGFDTDMTIVTSGKFNIGDWPSRKIAVELHRYGNASNDCGSFHNDLDRHGWSIQNPGNPNSMPVVMTEFGFAQAGNDFRNGYAQCLKTFFATKRAGWMYWVLAGSYYIRSGKQDFDETWGILNHDWSGMRNLQVVNQYFLQLPR